MALKRLNPLVKFLELNSPQLTQQSLCFPLGLCGVVALLENFLRSWLGLETCWTVSTAPGVGDLVHLFFFFLFLNQYFFFPYQPLHFQQDPHLECVDGGRARQL